MFVERVGALSTFYGSTSRPPIDALRPEITADRTYLLYFPRLKLTATPTAPNLQYMAFTSTHRPKHIAEGTRLRSVGTGGGAKVVCLSILYVRIVVRACILPPLQNRSPVLGTTQSNPK